MIPEIDSLLEVAIGLCQWGALDEAERILRRLAVLHSRAPDVWNTLALVLYRRNQFDEAAQVAARATKLRPRVSQYWLTQGNIAMARNCHGEARSSFRKAIECNPGFAEAHCRMGMSCHLEALYSEAAKSYREALRYAPDVAEIHWRLAEAQVAAGQLGEALAAYREAFERDPAGNLDRRGCLELLRQLRFESLPGFWAAEINRIFHREGVDKAFYVGAGLKALRVRDAFRSALQAAASGSGPGEWPLRDVLTDSLFHVLLRDCLIVDAEVETFLTKLRAGLLLDDGLRARTSLEFLSALALQCFNNGFIYAESRPESDRIAGLQAEVESMLQDGNHPEGGNVRPLLVLAAYRSLDTVRGTAAMLAPARQRPGLEMLLRRSVLDAQTERDLKREIPAVGAITDEVSCAVRDMYEEHPYPRWFALDRERPFTFSQWVERDLPVAQSIAVPDQGRVLIAGCGTGRDAIRLAANLSGAQVLAVDLSLSSLAYASRMAREKGVTNIRFVHGDILDLDVLPDRFDMISSTGVLHHMRDPQAGLRVLTRLLRPGGVMKLGLYSVRGRSSINAAREVIHRLRLAATEPEIRKFRQQVFDAGEASAFRDLATYHDFYSMSTCRDLLFHVQEHQLRLPQIDTMLRDMSLKLLGLADLPADAITAYRRLFPGDPLMTDLANWDVFEAQYPATFTGMYKLWCAKTLE